MVWLLSKFIKTYGCLSQNLTNIVGSIGNRPNNHKQIPFQRAAPSCSVTCMNISEKQSMHLEGKIPQLEFFTLSVVGKRILMDELLDSWLALQQPHCQEHQWTLDQTRQIQRIAMTSFQQLQKMQVEIVHWLMIQLRMNHKWNQFLVIQAIGNHLKSLVVARGLHTSLVMQQERRLQKDVLVASSLIYMKS